MKSFLLYLRSKRKECLLFFLIFLIFLSAFSLYHLPVTAVFYPFFLCLLLLVILSVPGYLKFRRKLFVLQEMQSLGSLISDVLPQPSTTEEEQYQALIRSLCLEIAQIRSENSSSYRDMIDYYTVWVHQIKTPIASMKLRLENEDSALSRNLRSDLFRIEQYVEMVLAFLRLDSEESDYVFREYEMDQILRSSVRKFAPEFIGRKIRLSYEKKEKHLITDEKWLSFVIEQLLSNALKYTREGTVAISWTDENTLCISDTGIGIAPEDLPRIFEKGYTGVNGRLDHSASGLGLYLCKKICTRLGICITASSEPGKGSSLYLLFDPQPQIRD